MANLLPRSKQISVLSALVEGCSVRSTARLTGVDRDTVLRVLVRVGQGCDVLHDKLMRNLTCERIEVDELWAFVGKKQRRITAQDDASCMGDAWTFVSLDPVSKICPSYMTGKRDAETTDAFIADLAKRLGKKVQLSADGLALYDRAVLSSFGADVDFASVVKQFEAEPIGPGRYSPPRVTSVEKTPKIGSPVAELVSTSLVENKHRDMRMTVRRFTRLTNAHSKKWENHCAAVSLHFAHYNFVRVHGSLRTSPAMAAGILPTLWSMEDLLDAASERGEAAS